MRINSFNIINNIDPAAADYTPTIGNRLDDARVSWKWYSGGWSNALNGNADQLFQYHQQHRSCGCRLHADDRKSSRRRPRELEVVFGWMEQRAKRQCGSTLSISSTTSILRLPITRRRSEIFSTTPA